LAAALLCIASACAASVGTGTLPLVKVADVPLGGRTTRIDYASYDQGRHLLFIAHLGDSSVIVFDTRANKVVARIAGVKAVHGTLRSRSSVVFMRLRLEATKSSRSTRRH
jgi:hypothetical protein